MGRGIWLEMAGRDIWVVDGMADSMMIRFDTFDALYGRSDGVYGVQGKT